MEMTFAMIKPNAVKSGLIGRIIDRYIAAGLSVCAVKMHQMTSADARGFYAEHVEKPFFPELEAYMTKGPSVMLALGGENAIAKVRAINGATNPAKAEPGTLRYDFAPSMTENPPSANWTSGSRKTNATLTKCPASRLAASSKFKQPPRRHNSMQWIIKYLTSSIGKKQIMGCTGAFLALFIFGHMCGNFQLLNFDQVSAQASYNAYTEFLTGFNPLHFPIKMIYLVELVLVAAFALHIFLAIKLKIENKKARGGIDYELNVRKGKKTFATFTMIWSGLFILGFLVQHLMMLKFGEHYLYMNDKGEIVRDMWLTTIQMLGNPAWAAFYVISMFVIGMHLFHAISSAFQTLGIAHQKWTPVIDLAGILYSIVVALGFAVTAAGAFYLANQPETQALIEKSRALQPQYEMQLNSSSVAK